MGILHGWHIHAHQPPFEEQVPMTYSRPCVQAIRVLAILPSSNKFTVFGKFWEIIAGKLPVGDLVRGSAPQNAPNKKLIRWNWPRLLGGGSAREFAQNPKIRPDLSSSFIFRNEFAHQTHSPWVMNQQGTLTRGVKGGPKLLARGWFQTEGGTIRESKIPSDAQLIPIICILKYVYLLLVYNLAKCRCDCTYSHSQIYIYIFKCIYIYICFMEKKDRGCDLLSISST